jgi:hypothetical protein
MGHPAPVHALLEKWSHNACSRTDNAAPSNVNKKLVRYVRDDSLPLCATWFDLEKTTLLNLVNSKPMRTDSISHTAFSAMEIDLVEV